MNNPQDIASRLMQRLASFKSEAHRILGVHESAPSRVILLEGTYRTLTALSLTQDELLRHALRCLENGLYRAAHVMAWAGFMDFLEEKIASDALRKVRHARPSWGACSVEELREQVPESQLLDVTREIGLCTKNQVKALHGLLNKRNECAHPSGYKPDLNQSLGYISEVLHRISLLQRKTV